MRKLSQSLIVGIGAVLLGASAFSQSTTPSAYDQAKQAFLEADFARAQMLIDKALADHPKSSDAHRLQGSIFAKTTKFDAALEEYRKALQFNSKDADSHYNIGWVLSQQGKLKKAESAYSDSLKIKADPVTLNNRGLVRYWMKDFTQARKDFQAAVAAKPGYAQPLLNLGRLNLEDNRTADAIAQLTTVIGADPSNVMALELRATAYEKIGKVTDAKRDRAAAAAARTFPIKPTFKVP
jgi:Tfp pilus assembly protein PilF